MSKKGSKSASPDGIQVVCRNARALKRYDVDERLEAGIVLQGSEVKSLRASRADLEAAYASIDGNELYLHKMHVAPYEQAGVFNHEPTRSRKLLVHRREIERLHGRLAIRGYTLIPTQVYFKNGRAKVELGLAKSKKVGDKREDIRREQDLREARSAIERSRS